MLFDDDKIKRTSSEIVTNLPSSITTVERHLKDSFSSRAKFAYSKMFN